MKTKFIAIITTLLLCISGAATWYYLERYQPAQERDATLASIAAAYGEAQALHADRFLHYYAVARDESYTALWRQTAEADPDHPFQLLESIEAYASYEARDPSYTWYQVIELAKVGVAQAASDEAVYREMEADRRDATDLAWLPIAEWTGKKATIERYTAPVRHPAATAGRLRVSFTQSTPYGDHGLAIAVYNQNGVRLTEWRTTETDTEEILLGAAQAYTIEVTANSPWTVSLDEGIPNRVHQAELSAARIQAEIDAQHALDNPRYQYEDARAPIRRRLTPEERRPTAPGYTYTPAGSNTDLTIPTTIDEHGRRVQVTAPR